MGDDLISDEEFAVFGLGDNPKAEETREKMRQAMGKGTDEEIERRAKALELAASLQPETSPDRRAYLADAALLRELSAARARVAELEGEVEREPCPVCGEGTMRWGENPQRYTCDNCGAQFADAEAQFVKFANESEDIAALEGREGKALALLREIINCTDGLRIWQDPKDKNKLELIGSVIPMENHVGIPIKLMERGIEFLAGHPEPEPSAEVEVERLKEKLLHADGALVDILAVLLPENPLETSLRDMAKTPSEIADMVKAEVERYRAALGETGRHFLEHQQTSAWTTWVYYCKKNGIDPEALKSEPSEVRNNIPFEPQQEPEWP